MDEEKFYWNLQIAQTSFTFLLQGHGDDVEVRDVFRDDGSRADISEAIDTIATIQHDADKWLREALESHLEWRKENR